MSDEPMLRKATISNPVHDLARAAAALEQVADVDCSGVKGRKDSLLRVAAWLWRRIDAMKAGADPETGEVPK